MKFKYSKILSNIDKILEICLWRSVRLVKLKVYFFKRTLRKFSQNFKNSFFAENTGIDTFVCESNGTRTYDHIVRKRTLNHLAKLAKYFWMMELRREYLSVRCIWLYVVIISRTRFRVSLHSIIAWMSRNSLLETGPICLSDCNGTQTHSHLVRKRTLNHLAI